MTARPNQEFEDAFVAQFADAPIGVAVVSGASLESASIQSANSVFWEHVSRAAKPGSTLLEALDGRNSDPITAEDLAKAQFGFIPFETAAGGKHAQFFISKETQSGTYTVLIRDITELVRWQRNADHASHLKAIGQLSNGVLSHLHRHHRGIQSKALQLKEDLPHGSQAAAKIDDLIEFSRQAQELPNMISSWTRVSHTFPETVRPADLAASMIGLLKKSLAPSITLDLDIVGPVPETLMFRNDLRSFLSFCCVGYPNERLSKLGGGAVTLRISARDEADLRAEGLLGLRPGKFVQVECDLQSNQPDDVLSVFKFSDTEWHEPVTLLDRTGGVMQAIGREAGGICVEQVVSAQRRKIRLLLPEYVKPEEAEKVERRKLTHMPKGKVLLMVFEDGVRSIIESVLTDAGMNVVGVASVTEAREVLSSSEKAFGLMLLDYNASEPHEDRLFASDHEYRCPVIFTAELDETHKNIGYLKPRGAAYLRAPFTVRTLREKIQVVLEEAE